MTVGWNKWVSLGKSDSIDKHTNTLQFFLSLFLRFVDNTKMQNISSLYVADVHCVHDAVLMYDIQRSPSASRWPPRCPG